MQPTCLRIFSGDVEANVHGGVDLTLIQPILGEPAIEAFPNILKKPLPPFAEGINFSQPRSNIRIVEPAPGMLGRSR